MHNTNNTDPQPATQATTTKLAVRTLAIIGIVALLALGTWGTVQVLRTGPSVFSGLSAAVSNFTSRFFPAGSTSLRIVIASYSVKNDEAFNLSWSTENAPEETSYAFVYECSDGLVFLTPNSRGGAARIACGETYEFDTTRNTLTLTPLSLENRFLDSAVKILMVKNDQIIAEDEVLLTVVNEKVSTSTGATTTPTTPPPAPSSSGSGTGVQPTYYAPIYTTVTTPRVSDPNGYVDLAVEIIRVGTLEGRSDRFSSNDRTLERGERGGIMFSVRNLGTKTSQEWSFEAVLPTRPSYTFRKSNQQELAPGDRIEYTLGFDSIVNRDEGEITIRIDPRDNINESNESNNRAEIEVEIDN